MLTLWRYRQRATTGHPKHIYNDPLRYAMDVSLSDRRKLGWLCITVDKDAHFEALQKVGAANFGSSE